MRAAVVPAVNSSWQVKEVPQPQAGLSSAREDTRKRHRIPGSAPGIQTNQSGSPERSPPGGRTLYPPECNEPTAVNTGYTIRPATLRQVADSNRWDSPAAEQPNQRGEYDATSK